MPIPEPKSVSEVNAGRVGRLLAADERQVQLLFREVFGDEISPAMLHWKYADGRGGAWGFWDEEGRLAAHCGVFYRTILAGGVRRKIAQLGDLMASRRKPGGLSRRDSPFFQIIQQVLRGLRSAENPEALAFGFPSDRAMRLGEHLEVFSTIDRMFELVFTPRPSRWNADKVLTISEADAQFAQVVDGLWSEMASDLRDGLVGIRDSAYLAQRYFAHPEHRYYGYLIRSFWRHRPLGVIVVRGEGEERELMDIIAPLHRLPRLLRGAQMWLSRSGGQRLSLWLASSHVERLAGLAQSSTPLEFRIMANPFSPAEVLERFRNGWWLTSGDTDYR